MYQTSERPALRREKRDLKKQQQYARSGFKDRSVRVHFCRTYWQAKQYAKKRTYRVATQ